MTTVVEAIYEQGVLKPSTPISLPDGARVKLTIESDTERSAWLKASQNALMKVWENDADDVFNELRDR